MGVQQQQQQHGAGTMHFPVDPDAIRQYNPAYVNGLCRSCRAHAHEERCVDACIARKGDTQRGEGAPGAHCRASPLQSRRLAPAGFDWSAVSRFRVCTTHTHPRRRIHCTWLISGIDVVVMCTSVCELMHDPSSLSGAGPPPFCVDD